MKRIFLLTAALALITLGRRDIWATNDRYVVAQFTNGTSTVSGGIQTTLSLQVFNDIANLQFPSHFMQRVDITVPSGFTGSGANGAFLASDFIPPTGWRVSSITGNVISLIDGTASQIYGPGISRTFLL